MEKTDEKKDKMMKMLLDMVEMAEGSGLSFDESVIAAGAAIGILAEKERERRPLSPYPQLGMLVTALVVSMHDDLLDAISEEVAV